jgi:hypothetical protein
LNVTPRTSMAETQLPSNPGWLASFPSLPAFPGRVRRDLPVVLVLAAVAFWQAYTITLHGWHLVPVIHEAPTIRTLLSAAPYVAAALAALAIVRPWPAFLAILLLTPYWDATQVSWYMNDFQVILQTVFALALGVGCVVSRRHTGTPRGMRPVDSVANVWARPRLRNRLAAQVTIYRVGAVALVAFLILEIGRAHV